MTARVGTALTAEDDAEGCAVPTVAVAPDGSPNGSSDVVPGVGASPADDVGAAAP
jgi:hypothetical protein